MLRCIFTGIHEAGYVGKFKNRCFGQNIYRLRNSAQMTQEQLAEKADISRRYVQMIESSQYTPTVEVAAKLRSALNVSWDELMKGM
jgi:transcriptional regulator with XRE-family HTH domain